MNQARCALIRGGRFFMGNTRADPRGWDVERPVHEVRLSYTYSLGVAPVTFEAYDEFCAKCGVATVSDLDPRVGYRTGRGDKPVFGITWFDAVRYCNWWSRCEAIAPAYGDDGVLLDARGRPVDDPSDVVGWRLPTEAEWEYAARGGHAASGDQAYAGSHALERVGWYWRNSGQERLRGREEDWHPSVVLENRGMIQAVAKKAPNVLGLYDMSGNVWEWCHDWFGLYPASPVQNPIGPLVGVQRVIRGGSWLFPAAAARVSYRNHDSPACPVLALGFRLARTVTE